MRCPYEYTQEYGANLKVGDIIAEETYTIGLIDRDYVEFFQVIDVRNPSVEMKPIHEINKVDMLKHGKYYSKRTYLDSINKQLTPKGITQLQKDMVLEKI